MKRDKELIRKILEYSDKNQDPSQKITAVTIDGYGEKTVTSHLIWLAEDG